MDPLLVLFTALNNLIAQLIGVVPKLIIALLIWYIGKYFLGLASALLRKIDIKSTDLDDKAIDTLSMVINGVGRVILVLIILDYLGIGSSVVSALAQGITFAIAIALGLAFGKALEPDAKKIVAAIRGFTHK